MAINCQTNISVTDENHRSVEFTVSVSEMEKLFDKGVGEFRKQVSMKGFRPGQVPKQLFVSRFGDEVYRETVDRVVNEDLKNEFEKIVETWKTDDKLEIAAPAEHGDLQADRGQDLVYKLNIALNKPLTVQGYKDLGVKVPALVVAEEEINDVVQSLRKRLAKELSVNRPSKNGDIVKGKYLRQAIDGEEKPLPENSDFELEISEEINLKELKEALTGVSAGQEKEFTIHYPSDHPNAELKGKTADYKVEITEVYELELPAQDEKFYSIAGAENEADLKSKISDDILKERLQRARQIALKEAFDKLIAQNPFPILEEQIKYTAERSLQQHHQHHEHEHDEEITVSKEQLDAMRPEISRAIQEDRILRAIVEQEALKPTQGQVDARIQEIADSARMDFALVKDSMRKNGQINKLRESLKLELAQNLLIGENLPEKTQENV
ncbi:MAG: trigger factor [Candidatus Fibromonas sp.]|nr:trigger factor [Candidatus Fibromonas sp.]